jgi:hypothetical protein
MLDRLGLMDDVYAILPCLLHSNNFVYMAAGDAQAVQDACVCFWCYMSGIPHRGMVALSEGHVKKPVRYRPTVSRL